jgi:hypothetical protein
MRITSLALLTAVTAQPAFAASGPFFSLGNTDFVVLLGFLLFLAIIAYFKIPALLGGMLDKRATDIRDELDEAKALREDAQKLLASYERKQKEVQEQADRIVEAAKRTRLSLRIKRKRISKPPSRVVLRRQQTRSLLLKQVPSKKCVTQPLALQLQLRMT